MSVTHPNPSKVYLCPACHHRQALHQRQDSSVACYSCGAEVPDKRHLGTRQSQRGGA